MEELTTLHELADASIAASQDTWQAYYRQKASLAAAAATLEVRFAMLRLVCRRRAAAGARVPASPLLHQRPDPPEQASDIDDDAASAVLEESSAVQSGDGDQDDESIVDMRQEVNPEGGGGDGVEEVLPSERSRQGDASGRSLAGEDESAQEESHEHDESNENDGDGSEQSGAESQAGSEQSGAESNENGGDGSEQSGAESNENDGDGSEQSGAESQAGADADADEVAAIRAELVEVNRKARMDELQEAMGVKDLNRRLECGCDDKKDHHADEPSKGVVVTTAGDAWGTKVVTVDPGCVLRLAPRSRLRAIKIATLTITGEKKVKGGGANDGTPQSRFVGSAVHQFAKTAQEYFSGNATAPPNVWRFATHFGRPHAKSLAVRFAAMARPYRDGVIEGMLHFWEEVSKLTEEEYDQAIHLILENGSKGPAHSLHNRKMVEGRKNVGGGEKKGQQSRKRPAGAEKAGASRPKRSRKN